MNLSNGTGIIKAKESRLAFAAALTGGLVAHAYRMLNFLPGADGMEHLTGVATGIAEGDFLAALSDVITSPFSLSWVNGLFSLLYLAVAVVLLVNLFEITGTIRVVLTAVLWVSFPAVTSAFAYMGSADIYMLSYLLIVLALWMVKRAKNAGNYAVAVLCMVAGLGIFHESIGLLLALILLGIVSGAAKEDAQGIFGKKPVALFGCAGFAILAYGILLYAAAAIRGRQLAVHFGIVRPGDAWAKTVSDLQGFVDILTSGSYPVYGWCLCAAVILTLVLAVWTVCTRKLYRRPAAMLVYLVGLGLLPFAAFVLNFLEQDMTYETYMEFAAVVPLLVPVLQLEELTKDAPAGKKISAMESAAVLCAALLAVTCFSNIVNSNVNYFYMTLSYEKTYANCMDLLNRMGDCGSFDRGCTVAVFGQYDSLDFLATESVPVSGITPKVFLENQEQYITFWANACGIRFTGASGEARAAILDTEAYRQMATYPSYGCVAEIDGIIVVKLGEES